MNRKFTYLIVVVLIALAVFFFVKKSDDATDNPDSSMGKASENDLWIELKDGLKYKDVVMGTGQEAKNGDAVATHYTGTLEDGTKFDSSYDRGEPFAFLLGAGQVIKGWDIGIAGMKVGGKRKLVIPPELGYGSRNVGNGKIPPNSTLFFDVELIAVQTPKTQ